MSSDPDRVGAVQAITLAPVLCGVLVYTLCKAHIRPLQMKNKVLCALIDLCLGTFASFICIGGGQAYLVVLFFLFGYDFKVRSAQQLICHFI